MTKRKEIIIDVVMSDIREQIKNGDETVLAELLSFVPYENLVMSLNEDVWHKFFTKKEMYLVYKK